MTNFKNFKFTVNEKSTKNEIHGTVEIKGKFITAGWWRANTVNEARNKAFNFINGDASSKPRKIQAS